MKKQLRKIALAVVFALTATMCAPAGLAMAAAKTFTYAEQQSGDKVTTLFMDCNEKIDLKFLGVSNWKSYKYKWASSNEKVAVVDSNGLITALSEGTTTIKLMVGDGKEYTSSGVLVTVGKTQEVTIGTASQEEIKSCTLEVGKTATLKANGIKDNVGGRYSFVWSSTDTSVVKVDNSGKLTAVAPGLAVIQLKVTKAFSGKVMEATPIAVLVNAKNTPTPTVKPTTKPTATPTPTKAPNTTTTPTPTVAPTNGTYTVNVISDRAITLTFKNKVTYTAKDVEFNQVLEAGNEDILIKLDVESVELDSTGKVMTISTEDVLTTDRYNVKVGTDDKGTTFSVSIGEPNKMELVYSCLGKEGVAYAYDEEVGLDVPVTLSYKLYYNDIEVTESYAYDGYIEYELVSPVNSDYVNKSGEQLYFYAANRSAAVRATYTYFNDRGTEKVLTDDETIKAKTLGNYNVTHVANWTIVDSKTTTIDWNNPVKSVVAGSTGYKVVALLADSYGYYYSTDERGVNKAKNIYSTEDPDTLFYMRGYSYAFSPSNDTNYYIDGTGTLYADAADARAAVYITLFNSDAWTSGEKRLDAWQFTIKEASKLATIKLAESAVTLVTNALNNADRFCTTDVEIQLIDQYQNEYTGEPDLVVTSSNSTLNNYIDSYAHVTKNSNNKLVLHIDGAAIYEDVKSTVTFYVSDPETNKRSSGVRVTLKNPADKDGDIEVGSWGVGMKEDVISFGNGLESEVAAQAELEIYQLSKNGAYKVGLLTEGEKDEKNNAVHIKLQEKLNHSFNSGCEAGDIYVLVLGPDGKVVQKAEGTGLGVDLTSEGKVIINVTESLSNITSLPEGEYTISVTKINTVDSNGRATSKKTNKAYFRVEDNTKDIAVAGYNNNRRTSNTVSNDEDMKEIICELFVFTLGGAKWTSLDSEMITYVDYEPQGNGRYRIKSIEFKIPAEGNSNITYAKTVKLTSNPAIYTGVDD